jgi:hypothetical protein
MPNIFEKINELDQIEDTQFEWIIPELMSEFKAKISYLAQTAYSRNEFNAPKLAISSFEEQAANVLKKAVSTYIIKGNKKNIKSYLFSSLKHLSNFIHFDNLKLHKEVKPICPACKEFKQKHFLIQENNLLKCNNCIILIKELEEQLNNIDDVLSSPLYSKYKLRLTFSLHSKKGYKCKDCYKFIPRSSLFEGNVSCPYINCNFVGAPLILQPMAHPGGISMISSCTLLEEDSLKYNSEYDELGEEFYSSCISLISELIKSQIKVIERSGYTAIANQKILMYKAYQMILDKYPDEIISYLIFKKSSSNFNIQSKIFQEYVILIENYLPFTAKKANKNIEICSLLDENLNLFIGISEFISEIKNNTIKNETKEEYIGGKNFKNYGPCFLGKLISVSSIETGENIEIEDYSFVNIYPKYAWDDGTKVLVKHFRMPSHYDINHMRYLQKTRKNLVNAIDIKLKNGR